MDESGRTTAKICYVLGIIGLFVGICMVAGAVIAYIGRSKTDSWIIETHFDNFIKYFWFWLVFHVVPVVFIVFGFVFIVLGEQLVYTIDTSFISMFFLLFIVIFVLIYLILLIFFLVKFCLGFSALSQGEPIE